MKKTVCLLILFSVLMAANVSRAGVTFEKNNVYVEDISVAELEEIYDELLYDKFVDPDDNVYPRIFVKAFPGDYAGLKDQTARNRLFIKILTPLALSLNDEILNERRVLFDIQNSLQQTQDFNDAGIYFLEKLAQKYDVNTPFKGRRRHLRLLNELLRRVDVVPPSVLISAAAVYSNWGTSRLATEGNNIYKAREWYTDEGLIPVGDEKEPYRYKIYPSLEAAMREYILKINTGVNYEAFWDARQVARRRGPVYGHRMDWAFLLDSNLQNYGGLIDYVNTYYRLHHLDVAELEPENELED